VAAVGAAVAAAAAEVAAVGGAVALPRTFASRLRFACFRGGGGEELLRCGGRRDE